MGNQIPKSGFFDAYVACPNEEDAAPFLARMEERGYQWLSGTPLSAKTEWGKYKSRMVYHVRADGRVSITRDVYDADVFQMDEFMAELSMNDENDNEVDISNLM